MSEEIRINGEIDDHTIGTPIDREEVDHSQTFGGVYIGHYFKCAKCGITFWRGRTRKQ